MNTINSLLQMIIAGQRAKEDRNCGSWKFQNWLDKLVYPLCVRPFHFSRNQMTMSTHLNNVRKKKFVIFVFVRSNQRRLSEKQQTSNLKESHQESLPKYTIFKIVPMTDCIVGCDALRRNRGQTNNNLLCDPIQRMAVARNRIEHEDMAAKWFPYAFP